MKRISVRNAKKCPLNIRKNVLIIRKNVHKKCEKVNEVKERLYRKEKYEKERNESKKNKETK